ncbi:MAG: tyrosine-type recombinase/integrase [Sporichthyaceae bacterium]
MTTAPESKRQQRGRIDRLPSGSYRVRVAAGRDPVTGKRFDITESVAALATDRDTRREAERVRTRLLNQVDERRNPRTKETMNELLDRWLAVLSVEQSTRAGYVGKIDKHLRPTIGKITVGKINAEMIETLYAHLRKCREHCGARPGSRCRVTGDPRCHPLSAGSIRVVHSILKSSLNRAVRWQWIAINPMSFVDPPSIPTPDPSPPNAEEAAAIVAEAWKDPAWGMLIWLAMTAGSRRGELCALRWSDLDLDRGLISVGRSIGQVAGATWEKDTKTHQRRTLSLDEYTVELLAEHRARCDARAAELGVTLRPIDFVFSLDPDSRTPVRPNTVTQRYSRMAKRLGLDTHFHSLRHYSATELIAAGVDPRTVAGRLGHGGGGSTTLRVYSAWVPESDRKAANVLAGRMPLRPS